VSVQFSSVTYVALFVSSLTTARRRRTRLKTQSYVYFDWKVEKRDEKIQQLEREVMDASQSSFDANEKVGYSDL